MSSKSQEAQNKKGRLGRGLNSLLGSGGGALNSSEALMESNISEPQNLKSKSTLFDSQNTSTSTAPNALEQKAALVTTQNSAPSSTINNVNTVQPIPPESRVWKIAVDKLNPNEYQPRQKFNKETLQELAASIKEKGILQPIVARRHLNGALEIISGERRWRAAQMAGLHEVPVLIKSVNDQDSLELAIIENIQREDLNPIDEAEAYQKLADEFKLTQQQIAEKVSKDRATVANSMRLLSLPVMVREMLGKQEISVGHAKVLLSLNDPKTQHQLAKKVISGKLSVRALEKVVQGFLKKPEESLDDLDSREKAKSRLAEAAALELQRLIGTKVNIDYNLGKGKISIAFYSDEEFNDITEKMKKAWQK